MVNPTGYTALDLVGYTDKGPYAAATNYVKNDLAHHNGIIWRCLIDDTIGITPVEGVNWTVFINAGSAAAEEIIAPIETSPAGAAHTSGTQLIYNDTLYDVIANISIGDSLTVGTNIQAAPKISSQIQTLTNETATINNVLGAKNLLPNTATTQVIYGVTFTVNSDDGSVTANGTATNNAYLLLSASFNLPKGEYIFSSNANVDTDVYSLTSEAYQNGSWVNLEWGEGGTRQSRHTFDEDVTVRTNLVIKTGKTVTNAKFYPMIRPASIADDTYVPYAMTNRELTKKANALNYVNISKALTLQNSYEGYATLKISGYSGIIHGRFKCKNVTSENVDLGDMPSNVHTIQSGIVLRDGDNGALITAWTDTSGRIATYQHSGTMVVDHYYYFSIPVYSD